MKSWQIYFLSSQSYFFLGYRTHSQELNCHLTKLPTLVQIVLLSSQTIIWLPIRYSHQDVLHIPQIQSFKSKIISSSLLLLLHSTSQSIKLPCQKPRSHPRGFLHSHSPHLMRVLPLKFQSKLSSLPFYCHCLSSWTEPSLFNFTIHSPHCHQSHLSIKVTQACKK